MGRGVRRGGKRGSESVYSLDVCVFCLCASLCVQQGTGEEEGEGNVCVNTKIYNRRGGKCENVFFAQNGM